MAEFSQLFHGVSFGGPAVASNHGDVAPVPLIQADDDIGAVTSWLTRFQGSAHTVDAARKESERFLLWLQDQELELRALAVEDLARYVSFLRDPQPADKWVGPPKPRFVADAPNPLWRPFAGPLAASSAKQATTILFGLFEYLVAANYLRVNLWRLLQKKKISKSKSVERYLPNEARNALFAYVRNKAHGENSRGEFSDFRNQWLISVFYLSAARRSEVANARMSHLVRDDSGWWWRIRGKGDKVDDVPLTEQFLDQLQAYRLAAGMTALPSPTETEIPLVGDIYKGRRPIGESAVYKLVKETCARAAQETEDPYVKATLLQASPHWLRHTAASDQLNQAGLTLATVSRNLRHSDISTTSHYLHVDRAHRHAETQKHVLPAEVLPKK